MDAQKPSAKPRLVEYLQPTFFAALGGIVGLAILWVVAQLLFYKSTWDVLLPLVIGYVLATVVIVLTRVFIYWRRYGK